MMESGLGRVAGVAQMCHKTRPGSWRSAGLVFAVALVVIIMVSPTGAVGLFFTADALRSTAPVAVPDRGASAALDLAAASATLARGNGPARGSPVTCNSLGASMRCQGSDQLLGPHPHVSGSGNLSWTDMSPQLSTAPVPMYLAGMTYDYYDGYVLLFGGDSPSLGVLSGTWIFSGGAWSQLTVSGPGPVYVGTMAYDFADHYVLMFGGYSGSTYYNDTWTFSNGTWSELFPSSAPSARWRQAMAWDGTDNYMVLYGGTTASLDLGDTWTYAHGTWTDITKTVTGNPPPTFRGAMAWDGSDGYDILFGGVMQGGFGGSSGSNYTWAYVNLTWKNLTKSAGRAPSARLYESMVWDNSTDSVVLFGGAATESGGVTNDTWFFHNGTWRDESKNLTKAPSARGFEMSAYNPVGSYVILFAGYDGSSTYYNDTWGLGAPILAGLSVFPREIDLGQGIAINASAFSDHRPLAYSYAGLPSGCTGGNVTRIRCTPSVSGTFTITLTVNDTKGNQRNESAVVIVATPPVLTGFRPSRSPVTQGEPTVFMVVVQGGAPPLVYSYNHLPFGCLSSNTANLTCRPARPGTYTIGVSVSDYFGYVVNGTTSLQVVAIGKVTEFVATPDTLDVNTTTQFTVREINGTGPYAYAYSGLPVGCTSANTAQLLCTPTAANTSIVTVSVTDSSGSQFTATESVFVNPDLSITSFNASVTALDIGQSVTFTVRSTGGSGVDVWAYQGLPPGCDFVGGVLNRCSPTAAGAYTVLVTGTDAVNSSGNATVNISVATVPVAVLSLSPVGTDVFLTFTVTTTPSGGFPPYQYAYGGLPSSCGAPVTATFSCTSTSPILLSITSVITDSVGVHSARAVMNESIHAFPSVTAFGTIPAQPIVDRPAGLNLTIEGGTGSYRVTYSGLPPGCTSENVTALNCTPASVGSYQVSVIVTDARGGTGTASTWFNVSAVPASTTGLLGLPGSDGLLLLVGVGIAVLLVAAVALLAIRKRRNPPGNVEPVATEEAAPPTNGEY
ncbi:MAG: Kelch repeat-containing protein [Thermoplasmata archaeon]